jgi:D-glycero-D-manno-heptose 1,7-bisphosphate phosphatase
MNKLLLLDKDGTLTTPVSGEKFVQTPWDQKPMEGVVPGIDAAARAGWEIAICSNQGGIDAGYKTLENCFQEMRFALELFPKIAEAYFCPANYGSIGESCWRCWDDCLEEHRIQYGQFADELPYSQHGKTDYRKPGAGMLLLAQAIQNAGVVWYVGDRPEDEDAAKNAGVPFLSAEEWRSIYSLPLKSGAWSESQSNFLIDLNPDMEM